MGRVRYVCTTCSEHFTRKYSAKRHNITVHHNNGGEIVTLVEYLVRRSSGKYQASDPSWYRRRSEKSIHNFGRAMVADSMGNTFRPRGVQQETPFQSTPTPLSAIQPRPPHTGVLPYPTDPISQPIDTTNDEGTLS
jgi:hypothetical protein